MLNIIIILYPMFVANNYRGMNKNIDKSSTADRANGTVPTF